jgi:conjugal transfer/entry exclusion protein
MTDKPNVKQIDKGNNNVDGNQLVISFLKEKNINGNVTFDKDIKIDYDSGLSLENKSGFVKIGEVKFKSEDKLIEYNKEIERLNNKITTIPEEETKEINSLYFYKALMGKKISGGIKEKGLYFDAINKISKIDGKAKKINEKYHSGLSIYNKDGVSSSISELYTNISYPKINSEGVFSKDAAGNIINTVSYFTDQNGSYWPYCKAMNELLMAIIARIEKKEGKGKVNPNFKKAQKAFAKAALNKDKNNYHRFLMRGYGDSFKNYRDLEVNFFRPFTKYVQGELKNWEKDIHKKEEEISIISGENGKFKEQLAKVKIERDNFIKKGKEVAYNIYAKEYKEISLIKEAIATYAKVKKSQLIECDRIREEEEKACKSFEAKLKEGQLELAKYIKERDDLEVKAIAINGEISTLNNLMLTSEQDNNTINSNIDDIRKQINKLNEEVDLENNYILQLNENLAEENTEIETLNLESENLAEDIKRLNDEIQKINSGEIVKEQTYINSLNENINNITNNLLSLNNKIENKKNEVQRLNNELTTKKSEHKTKVTQFESKKLQLEGQIVSELEKQKRIKQGHINLKTNHDLLTQNLNAINNSINDLKNKKNLTENKIKLIIKEMEKIKETGLEKVKGIYEGEDTNKKIKDFIRDIEDIFKNLTEEQRNMPLNKEMFKTEFEEIFKGSKYKDLNKYIEELFKEATGNETITILQIETAMNERVKNIDEQSAISTEEVNKLKGNIGDLQALNQITGLDLNKISNYIESDIPIVGLETIDIDNLNIVKSINIDIENLNEYKKPEINESLIKEAIATYAKVKKSQLIECDRIREVENITIKKYHDKVNKRREELLKYAIKQENIRTKIEKFNSYIKEIENKIENARGTEKAILVDQYNEFSIEREKLNTEVERLNKERLSQIDKIKSTYQKMQNIKDEGIINANMQNKIEMTLLTDEAKRLIINIKNVYGSDYKLNMDLFKDEFEKVFVGEDKYFPEIDKYIDELFKTQTALKFKEFDEALKTRMTDIKDQEKETKAIIKNLDERINNVDKLNKVFMENFADQEIEIQEGTRRGDLFNKIIEHDIDVNTTSTDKIIRNVCALKDTTSYDIPIPQTDVFNEGGDKTYKKYDRDIYKNGKLQNNHRMIRFFSHDNSFYKDENYKLDAESFILNHDLSEIKYLQDKKEITKEEKEVFKDVIRDIKISLIEDYNTLKNEKDKVRHTQLSRIFGVKEEDLRNKIIEELPDIDKKMSNPATINAEIFEISRKFVEKKQIVFRDENPNTREIFSDNRKNLPRLELLIDPVAVMKQNKILSKVRSDIVGDQYSIECEIGINGELSFEKMTIVKKTNKKDDVTEEVTNQNEKEAIINAIKFKTITIARKDGNNIGEPIVLNGFIEKVLRGQKIAKEEVKLPEIGRTHEPIGESNMHRDSLRQQQKREELGLELEL